MAGGRYIEGRFIADEAYAAYLNGVVLERQGRLDAARTAYEAALQYDARSAELWTRLGVLRCRAPAASDPWGAFEQALALDATYEEAWTERARCRLERGELPAAASDAEKAVEPVLVLATVLERQGRTREASRWLTGALARDPSSRQLREAALAFASRTGDAALAEAQRRALSEMGAIRAERASVGEVDHALRRGEFDRARRLAVAAHLSSGVLALRAAALGQSDFARDQAALVLGADPADTDARVAAVVAADLARDDAALARALTGVPDDLTPLSPLAALAMSEVLRRRVGDDAARLLREMAGPTEKSEDPLIRAVAERK
jgi:tetratricopeptide (TPR) repeat protein